MTDAVKNRAIQWVNDVMYDIINKTGIEEEEADDETLHAAYTKAKPRTIKIINQRIKDETKIIEQLHQSIKELHELLPVAEALSAEESIKMFKQSI